jgi:hypothetical protein
MLFAVISTQEQGVMSSLERLEERRARGLNEVRELESLTARRPLFGFEERSLQRSRSLVKEMDEAIRALRGGHPDALRLPRALPAGARFGVLADPT